MVWQYISNQTKKEHMDTNDMERLHAPTGSTPEELARETRESTDETGLIEQVQPYYDDKEDFLTNVVALPDTEKQSYQPREEFYMAAHETEQPFGPLENVKPYEPLESRQEQIDRFGGVTYRDFMDSDGNIPNTYATGVDWQDKGTAFEAIASQPDPEYLSQYMPQVVRKNVDTTPMAMVGAAAFGALLPPRTQDDRHTRRSIDYVRDTTYASGPNMYCSGQDRAQEDARREKTNKEFDNPRLPEQSTYLFDAQPYIDMSYKEDMADRRNVMEAGVNFRAPDVAGGASMFAPAMNNLMEDRRPRRKCDEGIRSTRPIAYVGNSSATVQTAMYGRKRDNDRDTESAAIRDVLPMVQPQFTVQSRTKTSEGFGGRRVEGCSYFVPAADNAFDWLDKPQEWGIVGGYQNDALPGKTMDLEDAVAAL